MGTFRFRFILILSLFFVYKIYFNNSKLDINVIGTQSASGRYGVAVGTWD